MDFTSFKEFYMSRELRVVRLAVLAVLVLLAVFLFFRAVDTAQNLGRSSTPATDVITVQGSGTATLPPDIARLYFTIQSTEDTVQKAQAAATKQTNDVLDYVKGQHINDKDVRTTSYSISPQYSYPSRCTTSYCPDYSSPKITGYQVSQSVQITVRDLAQVGAILEGLGKLGVQNVSGPNFALDDQNAGYEAARSDAINDARAQATQLAKQLGVHLGKIVNFSESNGGYPYPMMSGMGGDMAVKSAAPSVPAGENTYNASVSITYELR